MRSIIEELYYGNIEPQELSDSEMILKLKKTLRKVNESEEKLISEFTDEQKEKFADFSERYNEFSGVSNADSFVTGFRLGARMMLDIFSQC